MVNDISAFFASEPEPGVAASAVESHLSRFWDPRMRRQIIEHFAAGGEGLSDISRAAVLLLAAEGPGASSFHANEDGTGSDAG
jgi:formate dehydrogenase subunit delta